MKSPNSLINCIFYAFLFLLHSNSSAQTPAFPTAYGGGAYATGGRGGAVYHVTSLLDDGSAGTLRWALGQPRPATIVFNVSGTIDIQSWLDIGGRDLTIAGQTAPIGGITIASTNGSRFRFRGDCENIIMRYIRVRPATTSGDDAWELYSSNYMRNIIIDHCSISYGGDECISIRGAGSHNITFQKLLVAEAKTGSLFGDSNNPEYAYDNSYLNSLFFNVSHRHPNASSDGRVDVINNVVQQHQYRLAGSNGDIELNHINNYYALGARNSLEGGGAQKNLNVYFGGNAQIYTAGNIADKGQFTDPNADNKVLWVNSEGGAQTTYASPSLFVNSAYPLIGRPFTIKSAEDAYIDVIQDVGANASLNADGTVSSSLDTQDEFYLEIMSQGEGANHPYQMYGNYGSGGVRSWWDEQMYADFVSSVGSTPINIRPNTYDLDNDGMADLWEINSFGDLTNDGTLDTDGDGYTDLENFLNMVDVGNFVTVAVESVNVTPSSATINIPETVQLSATIIPENATNQNGTWSSSNPEVATVSNNGLVIPISAGNVTITFTSSDGNFSDSAQITVTNIIIPVIDVTITPQELTLDIGEIGQLNAEINPANASNQSGIWFSSNEEVVIVNDQGIVTGISEGTATITFISNYDNSIIDSATVNVVDIFFGTYEFYNAISDTLIQEITDDTSFNLDIIGDQINFRSIPQGGDQNTEVESVKVEWTGAESGSWTESVPIYAAMTDHIDFDFAPYTVVEGTYNFTITYYSDNGGVGNIVAVDTFSLFFIRGIIADAGNDQSICAGESTTLTASGGTNYLWSTGETTSSITVSPIVTSTFTVTVSDEDGNSDEASVEVVVNNYPTADAGPDQTICEGETTTLTASGGESYLWNTGENSSTINVNPNNSTEYFVEVFNGNCSDTDVIIVNVVEAPQITVSEDVSILLGESTTLNASGGDNYLWNNNETTSSITVSPTETTSYTVTSIGANGCESTQEILVTVIPPFEAFAGLDQRICAESGDDVVLTANQSDTYLWNTGETTQSIVVSPLSTSTYTVTATLGQQEDSDSVIVFVDPNPNVMIINGETADILEGDFITLSATGANTYEWSNGATQPNIAVSPTTTTTYEVRGYINDCYDEKAITVNVYQQVNAYAGQDVTICFNDSVILTATGGDDYLWSTGETTQSIEVAPEDTTEYIVTVFNALDFDEATVTVEVDFACEETNVDVNDEPLDFSFKVYPNPTSDFFNINITGMSNDAKLYMYDVTGKLMLYEALIGDGNYYSFTKEVNVSSMGSGIYFLHLIEDENPNPEVFKLIIK